MPEVGDGKTPASTISRAQREAPPIEKNQRKGEDPLTGRRDILLDQNIGWIGKIIGSSKNSAGSLVLLYMLIICALLAFSDFSDSLKNILGISIPFVLVAFIVSQAVSSFFASKAKKGERDPQPRTWPS